MTLSMVLKTVQKRVDFEGMDEFYLMLQANEWYFCLFKISVVPYSFWLWNLYIGSSVVWRHFLYENLGNLGGSPMLVRLLVRFALGEMIRLLVRRSDSWWDGRTLGDIFGLLVRPLDSWWDAWNVGEINYHQDNNVQHWFGLRYCKQNMMTVMLMP